MDENEQEPTTDAERKQRSTGIGMCFGIAIGRSLGAALGSVALGLAVGLALGVGVGATGAFAQDDDG